MHVETVRLYLEMFAYAAGVLSILFLALQVRKERKLNEYQTLQSLEEKFTSLLWKGSDNGNIDQVWVPIATEKEKIFKNALENGPSGKWSLWNAMDEKDQDCYRFTRAGLEVLEQAFLAYKQNWVTNGEIWDKWRGWMISWKTTNPYTPLVLEEMSPWYTSSFVKYFEDLPDVNRKQLADGGWRIIRPDYGACYPEVFASFWPLRLSRLVDAAS
jgi:hypothetical protein